MQGERTRLCIPQQQIDCVRKLVQVVNPPAVRVQHEMPRRGAGRIFPEGRIVRRKLCRGVIQPVDTDAVVAIIVDQHVLIARSHQDGVAAAMRLRRCGSVVGIAVLDVLDGRRERAVLADQIGVNTAAAPVCLHGDAARCVQRQIVRIGTLRGLQVDLLQRRCSIHDVEADHGRNTVDDTRCVQAAQIAGRKSH